MSNAYLETKLTGYGNSSASVRYVSLWDTIFKEEVPMRFFTKPLETVFDCLLHENGRIEILTYPFTKIDKVMPVLQAKENEMAALAATLRQDYGAVPYPLFIEEDSIIPITKEHFTGYYPNYKIQDELFLFDNPLDIPGELPQIYCVQNSYRTGPYGHIFDMYAYSSHEAYDVADKPTSYGKMLGYSMYYIRLNQNPPDDIPDLNEINFPTNGKSSPPAKLNTKALQDIITRSGADKVTAKPPVTSLVKKEPEVISIPPAPEDLEGNIIKSVLEKGSINLTDVYFYGIAETLALLQHTETVVNVFVDIPGMVRKMCFYEGKVHVVTAQEEDVVEDILSASETDFIYCTEETFPSNINK